MVARTSTEPVQNLNDLESMYIEIDNRHIGCNAGKICLHKNVKRWSFVSLFFFVTLMFEGA